MPYIFFGRTRPINSNPNPEPEPEPEPEPSPAKLRWRPPALTSPITETIPIVGRSKPFNSGVDVITSLPLSPVTGRINLSDGQNIRMIGGALHPAAATSAFALALVRFTNSIFIEGLDINCISAVVDGIKAGGHARNIANPTLYTDTYIQNCRVMNVHAPAGGLHADCYQLDYLCKNLRLYRCTMSSNYQWLFLHPRPEGQPQLISQSIDIEDCNFFHNGIPGEAPSGRKPFFLANSGAPGEDLLTTTHKIILTNVWCDWADVTGITIVSPNASAGAQLGSDSISPFIHWPNIPTRIVDKHGAPAKVRIGYPPAGDFCPANIPGVNYTSPGYI